MRMLEVWCAAVAASAKMQGYCHGGDGMGGWQLVHPASHAGNWHLRTSIIGLAIIHPPMDIIGLPERHLWTVQVLTHNPHFLGVLGFFLEKK